MLSANNFGVCYKFEPQLDRKFVINIERDDTIEKENQNRPFPGWSFLSNSLQTLPIVTNINSELQMRDLKQTLNSFRLNSL